MTGDEGPRKTGFGHGDVCPAEHAGWLSTPLRRLWTDPDRILRGLIDEGQTVADLGCGPGFFTLPMARMAGPSGHVVAVDLQAEMLARLKERAGRAGLDGRISLHQCSADTLGELPPLDFALAFFMLHEVPDPARLLAEVSGALREGGRLLLVEPKGHVSTVAFAETVKLARAAGLEPVGEPRVRFSRARLFAARSD